MRNESKQHDRAAGMLHVLEVSRRLAAPCPLHELLLSVVEAGCEVLQADRGSVFLYDEQSHELYMIAGTGIETLRFCADQGLAGECANQRDVLNISNCYADSRFNQDIDRKTGYRTNSMITAPLIGLEDKLVGVMQILNARCGQFCDEDEQIALALAGQAAVAIQRAQLLFEQQVKIRMEQDLSLARDIQLGVLPKALPKVAGYDIAAFSQPADQTGGDIYDIVALAEIQNDDAQIPEIELPQPAGSQLTGAELADSQLPGLPGCVLLMLGDATGHGIGPALSVTQMRAMFRMGLRLGAGLATIRLQIDKQLEQDLSGSRFITAFFGILDPSQHHIEYESPGQAPLLCYHVADDSFETRDASGLPLGIMPSIAHDEIGPFVMAQGDIFILLTDGFYECQTADKKKMFGNAGVEQVIREHRDKSADQIVKALVDALNTFAPNVPQADDWTAIIIKRNK